MDIIEKAEISQKQELEAIKSGNQPSHDIVKGDKLTDSDIHWPSAPDKSIYYGLAGEVINLITPQSESDPIALLINFIIAFGSLVGKKAHFKVEADLHSMNMFGVLVGETSKARKGTSWSYIKNIFGAIDSEWKGNVQTGLSSGEGLIWAVRNEITKTKPIKVGGKIVNYEDEIVDSGVADKRLLVVEPEFASTLRVLGRDGNTLSAIIRNAWDTGDLQSLTKNSIAKATGAHISIIGHITKDELLKYLTSNEAGNGFGNRFLWICVKRSKILPFGGKIQDVNFAPVVEKLIEVIRFVQNEVDEIKWADETRPIWEFVYPKLSEGKLGLVDSITARAEAYVTRIACIYALLDKSDLIKPIHLKSALALWDYAEYSAKYIFKDMTGVGTADDIMRVLSGSPIGMSRTEISEFFGKHKSSAELSNAIDILIGLGCVKKETISTEGRSKEILTLIYHNIQKDNSLNSLNSQPFSYSDMVSPKIYHSGNVSCLHLRKNTCYEISRSYLIPFWMENHLLYKCFQS